jgi:signal transduction histidine kinase
MQTLITNLLKMAKLDAGIIELNKGEYILNDIIKQAAESFTTRLSKEQKYFEIKADSKVSYTCDKEWMLEALSNLIKNAVEHTRLGNQITVLLEDTPLMIKITVRDDGEGIHPDDINHIFKRFYRSRFSQETQGTGIGLTLTKLIIEMHEGFISVESTIKKGTTFTVHLPRLTKL